MPLIFNDFYTTDQLAALKRVTRRTVYAWLATGTAPAHEVIAGMYWFHKKAADAFQPPKQGRKKK